MNMDQLAVTMEFAGSAKVFLDLKEAAADKKDEYRLVRDAWIESNGEGMHWSQVVVDPEFLMATQKAYSAYEKAKRAQDNAQKRMMRRYHKLSTVSV